MNLTKNLTIENLDINDYLSKEVNLNFLHFITYFIIYVCLFIFLIVVNNIDTELRFKNISCMTYAVLISDIDKKKNLSLENIEETIKRDDIEILDKNLTFKFSVYSKLKKEYKKLKDEFKEMHEQDVSK